MKALSIWFILGYLLGCGTTGDLYMDESELMDIDEMEAGFDPDRLDNVGSTALYCVDLGMDEYDVPQNAVVLKHLGETDTVGKCHACQKISSEDFASMDIPESAQSACGGWFAGGGDYFYCIIKEGKVEVYAGWQDEGQIEEDDFGYHWKKTHSFDLFK